MKILLIGPYPPPHGGISVHLYEVRKQLHMAGIHCRVVNVDPRALESSEYIRIHSGADLFFKLVNYARRGWTMHVHTNGHNLKSWLVALTAGVAGLFGRGNVLTLHSGMAPVYLAPGRFGARLLARFTCLLYRRVIAVSTPVRDAVMSVGVGACNAELLPSFLFTKLRPTANIDAPDTRGRAPILGTTLFFRPEYGFHLLIEAVDQLHARHAGIACLVMGSGEQQKQAEEQVAQRGLQKAFFFLGNVEHEQCLAIMSQCDLFVRPALADGDANCVREALALGVPVVASNVGHRPPETVLFRTGDVADMIAKIEQTMAHPFAPASAREIAGNHIDNLIGIYGSL